MFHVNHLLKDDSHEMPFLLSLKNNDNEKKKSQFCLAFMGSDNLYCFCTKTNLEDTCWNQAETI